MISDKKTWNINMICVIISALPIIFLIFMYPDITGRPSTKIIGSNGMTVSKGGFVLLIIGLGVLWYYLALYTMDKIVLLNLKINQNTSRILLNSFFSLLNILLIISNFV